MRPRWRFRSWVRAQSPADLVTFAVLLAAVGGFLGYTVVAMDDGFGYPDDQPWRALWLAAVIVPAGAAAVGLVRGRRAGPGGAVALFYAAWAFTVGALVVAVAWWVTGAVAVFGWANDAQW